MINKVKLLQSSNLTLSLFAIRTCYDSFHLSDTEQAGNTLGTKDKGLLKKIIESKHESTLEHIVYTFYLNNVPRNVLQELARHRIASYSVKSTRYTLKKEFKDENYFVSPHLEFTTEDIERAKKYIYIEEDEKIHLSQLLQLDILLRALKNDDITTTEAKALLPESWLCNVVMTINMRSLRNFLQLRTSKGAYKYIRDLAFNMYESLPNEHKEFYQDCLKH